MRALRRLRRPRDATPRSRHGYERGRIGRTAAKAIWSRCSRCCCRKSMRGLRQQRSRSKTHRRCDSGTAANGALPDDLRMKGARKVVAVLDDQHAEGTSAADVSEALCRSLEAQAVDCVTVLAGWGKPSSDALDVMRSRVGERLGAIISVQDFVIGGSSDRATATRLHRAARRAGVQGDSPARRDGRSLATVRAGARMGQRLLPDRHAGAAGRRVSPWSIAAAAAAQIDSLTGIEVSRVAPLAAQIDVTHEARARWIRLQQTAQREQARRDRVLQPSARSSQHRRGQSRRARFAARNSSKPEAATATTQARCQQRRRRCLTCCSEDGVNLPEQGDALACNGGARDHDHRRSVLEVARDRAGGAADKKWSVARWRLLQANVKRAQAARLPQRGAEVRSTRTLQELKHLRRRRPASGARSCTGSARSAARRPMNVRSHAAATMRASNSLTRAIAQRASKACVAGAKPPGTVMVDRGQARAARACASAMYSSARSRRVAGS